MLQCGLGNVDKQNYPHSKRTSYLRPEKDKSHLPVLPLTHTHTHTHTMLTASGCFLLFPQRREIRRNYRAILLTDAWLSIESL